MWFYPYTISFPCLVKIPSKQLHFQSTAVFDDLKVTILTSIDDYNTFWPYELITEMLCNYNLAPRLYPFSMLNSAEHKIYPAHKC